MVPEGETVIVFSGTDSSPGRENVIVPLATVVPERKSNTMSAPVPESE